MYNVCIFYVGRHVYANPMNLSYAKVNPVVSTGLGGILLRHRVHSLELKRTSASELRALQRFINTPRICSTAQPGRRVQSTKFTYGYLASFPFTCPRNKLRRKNNTSGLRLIYEPMRMTGVSCIEPRLLGNVGLDLTLFTLSLYISRHLLM